MFFLVKRIAYPLILPTVLIVFSAVIIWQWPSLLKSVSGVKELKALLLILPVLPYAFFFLGLMMGWRYHNTAIMLASLALGLAYFAQSQFVPGDAAGSFNSPTMPEAVAFLLPFNLAFFSLLTQRRMFSPIGLFCLILVTWQVFVVALVCHPGNASYSKGILNLKDVSPAAAEQLMAFSAGLGKFFSHQSLFGLKNMSVPSFLAYALSLVFLLVRFVKEGDMVVAGICGTLVATFLGLTANDVQPSAVFYFSTAGIILIVTNIESSFSMAYMDELTGLPGRRSLNETLINLGREYAIGMIDIDHFKKFNDTYGHKTGDQVLKMVASRLKGMSGGAKTFRYGGEEFTAVFPGKSAEDALPHLQEYRRRLASTPFIVRGQGRPKATQESRGKGKNLDQKKVKVTVSIGVAEPNKDLMNPEKVLKEADKLLYKAKKAGRNRVVG